jgi:uncharacterized SAM-dependent methyltransferase
MHLVCTKPQRVRIGEAEIEVAVGEPIVTEHSYKHAPHAMRALLALAGWQVREVYAGTAQPFGLWSCEMM